jgi:hypothetical protein
MPHARLAAPREPDLMRTLLHTLCLAVASAVTAEFLLGDQYLSGTPTIAPQISELVLFTAFYGSAAVLIRELARRARVGWPGILTLALAFGVIEEGIVDQSLFNPDFAGQHLISYGFVPWLGTAGPWLIFVLTLHVVWSIGSPIAVMEGAFGTQPWVRHAGWLAVPAVLFVLGGAAIFVASTATGGFTATGVEMAVCAAIAAVLVILVFTVLRGRGAVPARERRGGAGFVTSVAAGLVLGGAFQLADGIPHSISAWVTALTLLVVLAAGILFAVFARPDAVGFGTGAILVYCVVGLVHAAQTGPAAVVEQVVLVLIALGVLAAIAVRHLRRTNPVDVPAVA